MLFACLEFWKLSFIKGAIWPIGQCDNSVRIQIRHKTWARLLWPCPGRSKRDRPGLVVVENLEFLYEATGTPLFSKSTNFLRCEQKQLWLVSEHEQKLNYYLGKPVLKSIPLSLVWKPSTLRDRKGKLLLENTYQAPWNHCHKTTVNGMDLFLSIEYGFGIP